MPQPSNTQDASPKHYRALFISDVHLGSKGCQAEALCEFLDTHTADTLYLVGAVHGKERHGCLLYCR